MRACTAYGVGYDRKTDTLYAVLYHGANLADCYEIEDTPSGMTVTYDERGDAMAVEIPGVGKRLDMSMPLSVTVDAQEPFELIVDDTTHQW